MRFVVGLIGMVLMAYSSYAQVKFYAQTEMVNMGSETLIQLKIAIENGDFENYTPPELDGLAVVNGPSKGSQVSVINGRMSQSAYYNYLLRPTRAGKTKIGEASVVINNQKYKTQVLSFDVSKSSNPAPSSSGTASAANTNSLESVSAINEKNLFLKIDLSKNKAYIGEPVVATYKLCTRLNLTGYQIQKIEPNTGCWEKPVTIPNDLVIDETINGLPYKVVILKKTILIPQVEGNVEIANMDMTANVKVREANANNSPFGNDPFFRGVFGDMFSYRMVPTQLKTNEVILSVESLPANSENIVYDGAIGDFTINPKLPAIILKHNEPFVYTLEISGTGNLNFITAPKLSTSEGLVIDDVQEIDQLNEGAESLSGKRIFNYTISPQRTGVDTIHNFKWIYFDTKTNDYKTVEIPIQILNIQSGNQSTKDKASINEPKWEAKNNKYALYFFGSKLHIGSFLLIFLCMLVLFFALYRKNMALNKPDDYRLISANSNLQKQIKKAQSLMTQNKKEAFYDTIRSALIQYISDKTLSPKSALHIETINSHLTQHNWQNETIQEVVSLWDMCNMALYAPSSQNDMKICLDKAKKIMV